MLRTVFGCLGAFVVSALAGLAIVAVAAILLLRSCAEGLKGDFNLKFGLGPQTGRQWCDNQQSARPFLALVNRALIGGTAFPTEDATTFFMGSNVLTSPPSTIAADTKTLSDALTAPGSVGGPQAGYTIPPTRAFAGKAAALRLDAYCADVPP